MLAEGPGVARGKKFKKIFQKNLKKFEKKFEFFLAFSVHKKFQPNRSSPLAGYRQHIYIYTMSCFII